MSDERVRVLAPRENTNVGATGVFPGQSWHDATDGESISFINNTQIRQAFAPDGHPLLRTRFQIVPPQRVRLGRLEGNDIVEKTSTTAPIDSFAIRTESGRGTLFSTRTLDARTQYILHIRATSDASTQHYTTDFIVFITVAEYEF